MTRQRAGMRAEVLLEIADLRAKIHALPPAEREQHLSFLDAAALVFGERAVGLWLRSPSLHPVGYRVVILWGNAIANQNKCSLIVNHEALRWLVRRAVSCGLFIGAYGPYRAHAQKLVDQAGVVARIHVLPEKFWVGGRSLVA